MTVILPLPRQRNYCGANDSVVQFLGLAQACQSEGRSIPISSSPTLHLINLRKAHLVRQTQHFRKHHRRIPLPDISPKGTAATADTTKTIVRNALPLRSLRLPRRRSRAHSRRRSEVSPPTSRRHQQFPPPMRSFLPRQSSQTAARSASPPDAIALPTSRAHLTTPNRHG